MTTSGTSKILLIGPLPPPNGGARISFKLFWDHLQERNDAVIHHVDLPVRCNRASNPPGGIDHIRTMIQILKVLMRLPFMDRIIIFASNNFAFSYGLVLTVYGKLWNKSPVIRFFGGQPLHTILKFPAPVGHAFLSMMRCAEKIIVQTNHGADQFPDAFKPKIRVIPGYRKRPGPKTAGKMAARGGPLKLLYSGRIHPEKGIEIIAQSFHRLYQMTNQNVEWHLYGAGSPDLIDRLAAMPGVRYHGSVAHDQLLEELPDYDLFVFLTQYALEGHSGSLIEALMAGIPAVVSDHPCVREMIQHHYNGVIIKNNDIPELSRILFELYSDKDLLKRLSQGAEDSGRRFEADGQLNRLIEECMSGLK